MAHYIFNVLRDDGASGAAVRDRALELLRIGMWGVGAGEPHRDALAAGDDVLVYVGAPEREFIGRAKLASSVRAWTSADAQAYPGKAAAGVWLTEVEEWDPPVPMSAVLAQIDPTEKARADFEQGVVRITTGEHETALAVAATVALP